MQRPTSTTPHMCDYCSKRCFELNEEGNYEVKFSFDYAVPAMQNGCMFFRWCFQGWPHERLVAMTKLWKQQTRGYGPAVKHTEYIRIVLSTHATFNCTVSVANEDVRVIRFYAYESQYNKKSSTR